MKNKSILQNKEVGEKSDSDVAWIFYKSLQYLV
jgi:hypothetical protein